MHFLGLCLLCGSRSRSLHLVLHLRAFVPACCTVSPVLSAFCVSRFVFVFCACVSWVPLHAAAPPVLHRSLPAAVRSVFVTVPGSAAFCVLPFGYAFWFCRLPFRSLTVPPCGLPPLLPLPCLLLPPYHRNTYAAGSAHFSAGSSATTVLRVPGSASLPFGYLFLRAPLHLRRLHCIFCSAVAVLHLVSLRLFLFSYHLPVSFLLCILTVLPGFCSILFIPVLCIPLPPVPLWRPPCLFCVVLFYHYHHLCRRPGIPACFCSFPAQTCFPTWFHSPPATACSCITSACTPAISACLYLRVLCLDHCTICWNYHFCLTCTILHTSPRSGSLLPTATPPAVSHTVPSCTTCIPTGYLFYHVPTYILHFLEFTVLEPCTTCNFVLPPVPTTYHAMPLLYLPPTVLGAIFTLLTHPTCLHYHHGDSTCIPVPI